MTTGFIFYIFIYVIRWSFCLWVADVPLCETSPAEKSEEKRMFSQGSLHEIYTVIHSLRASSPSYLGKRSEPRENARARGRGKESLQRSLINFHFYPGNPRTPQSVKTVTANVPQIKRVTIACQVTLDSRGRVELFIYKSLSQQHQSNVFNHWYVYFFHGDIELQRVRSDKNSLLWFSFRLLLKSRPYCSVEDYSPSQSPTKTSYICRLELENSFFLHLVLLHFTPVASN